MEVIKLIINRDNGESEESFKERYLAKAKESGFKMIKQFGDTVEIYYNKKYNETDNYCFTSSM